MDEQVLWDELGTLVCDVEDVGERRQVIVSGKEGCDIRVAETSDGPLTESVFGGTPRYHQVDVAACELVRLGWVLGSGDACSDPQGLVVPLRRFFGEGDVFLSDLMDTMDASGIPYAYTSCIPGEGVWYRPAKTRVGTVA